MLWEGCSPLKSLPGTTVAFTFIYLDSGSFRGPSAGLSATKTPCSTGRGRDCLTQAKRRLCREYRSDPHQSGGKVIYTEAQTFDRKQAAKARLKKRETDLAQPSTLGRPAAPLLREVIDQYTQDTRRPTARPKSRCCAPSATPPSASSVAPRSPASSGWSSRKASMHRPPREARGHPHAMERLRSRQARDHRARHEEPRREDRQ